MLPSLSALLDEGRTLVTAWSGLTDPLIVDALARSGFDAVTLDMQHGGHDERSLVSGIGVLAAIDVPAIVRIPVNRFDVASRALDMGASGIIAPMINSVEDARAFAGACKFPPQGERSWGPHRAMSLGNTASAADYLSHANREAVTFAMIETRAAYEQVEEIAAVDGIDALFVGPSDFSIAWTGGATVDPSLEDMMEAVARIADVARSRDMASAVFCVDPAKGARYKEMGFSMLAGGIDHVCLKAGARAYLDAARI